MAELEIGNRTYEVGKEFGDLPKAEQDAFVQEMIDRHIKKETDFMPHFNRGIARGTGGLVDLVNPFNQEYDAAQKVIEDAMQSIGISLPDSPPNTLAESFASGAGEGASMLVPGTLALKAGKGIAKGGKYISGVLDDAYRAATTPAGAASEVLAAGSAETAMEIGERAGMPDPLQYILALPSSIGTGMLTDKVARTGKRAVDTVRGKTDRDRRKASEILAQSATGSLDQAAKATLRDNPLSLTPMQQSGDEGLAALEAYLYGRNPKVAADIDANAQTTQKLASGDLSMPGNPATAQSFMRDRMDDYTRQLQAERDEILGATEAGMTGLRSGDGPIATNIKAVSELDAAYQSAKRQERRMWNRVDKAAMAKTSNARAVYRKWRSELGDSQLDAIPKKARKFLSDPKKAKKARKFLSDPKKARKFLSDKGRWGTSASIRNMQGLSSDLRTIARNARAGTDINPTRALIADEIAQAIQDDLAMVPDQVVTDAIAFSRALHQVYDSPQALAIRKRSTSGQATTAPKLALDKTIGTGGMSGAVAAGALREAGMSRQTLTDYVSSLFVRRSQKATVDPARRARGVETELDMKGATAFMRDNSDLLELVPELRKSMNDAVVGRISAEDMAGHLSDAIMANHDAKTNAIAFFTQNVPERMWKRLTDGDTAAAKELMNISRMDMEGGAIKGLRGGFSRHIVDSATTVKDGKLTLDARKLREAWQGDAAKQIFTADEIKRANYILDELDKMKMARAQRGRVAEVMRSSMLKRMLERMTRIAAVRYTPRMAGGQGSIQEPGMYSEQAQDLFRMITTDDAMDILADAVTDPALFRQLTQSAAKAKSEDYSRLFPYVLGYGAAIGIDDEEGAR